MNTYESRRPTTAPETKPAQQQTRTAPSIKPHSAAAETRSDECHHRTDTTAATTTGTTKAAQMNIISDNTAREILAALMAVPARTAAETLGRLQAEDFPNWTHQRIFEALTEIQYPQQAGQGAVIDQAHHHLLEQGMLKDRDNGLRAEMTILAGITGHPELLPAYTKEILENRWRRAAEDFAHRVLQHSWNSPKSDLVEALAGINTVREYFQRMAPVQAVKSAQNAA